MISSYFYYYYYSINFALSPVYQSGPASGCFFFLLVSFSLKSVPPNKARHVNGHVGLPRLGGAVGMFRLGKN